MRKACILKINQKGADLFTSTQPIIISLFPNIMVQLINFLKLFYSDTSVIVQPGLCLDQFEKPENMFSQAQTLGFF